ncbi:bifunctional UDP-sugar hydrolase/5'-nucleotidase [uncultured Pseudokineococcus sp.]|uniref:bifunctional metallophosphatase/5'-nucleotidase n=1 Tax=uncultured Pseudokineococcus sp. TaxID=1642928 RepID=UPI002607083A|nr:5'-nucleotidase C-terminal domain-containing protein [uncultured Pseudokineococcus sp.]
MGTNGESAGGRSGARTRAAGAVAALAAGVLVAATAPVAAADVDSARAARSATFTLVSTTDLHGNVLDWDYFRSQPYAAGSEQGLSHVASAVEAVREDRGERSVVVVDNGDAIQGTPLTYVAARGSATSGPVTETGEEHPMATALDAIGYDAQVVGNHEFNYGLDLLRAYEDDLDATLLGANVTDVATGEPALAPWTIERVRPTGGGAPVRVGIVGLTTPGSQVWDRQNVEGRLAFGDMVEAAQRAVPEVRAAGADVVVVLSHSGRSGPSSYDASLPPENVSDAIAAQVPGVDVVVAGHSHRDLPEAWVESQATPGKQVLVTQPYRYGASVTAADLHLQRVRGEYRVTGAEVEELRAGDFPEDPAFTALMQPWHQRTLDYVDTVVATSATELSARDARWQDTAIMDFVHDVQRDVVARGLQGTPDADLPVVSVAAPFRADAVFPAGEVTIRDVAGLYIYDNTLQAVRMTGAQLHDYLEYSAKYYASVPPADPADPTSLSAGTTPDYNLDQLAGVSYEIDLARPAGSRVGPLLVDGEELGADDEVVLAVNNYRRSGGGGFPHVAEAPLVYDRQQDIRQLLIDRAQQTGSIDPADFAQVDWRLVAGGVPLLG